MSGNGMRTLAWAAARDGLGADGTLVVDTGGGRRDGRAHPRRRDRRGRRRDRRHGAGHVRPRAQIPLAVPNTVRARRADFHGTHYEGDAAGHGQPASGPVRRRPCDRARHPARPAPRARRALPAPHQRRVRPGHARRSVDEIDMRVWERGVGETLSCGTGACAAAAVAHRRGLVGGRVVVHVPGGDLVVDARRHHPPRRPGRARLRRRARASRSERRVSRRRLTATEVDLGVVRQRALLVGTGYRPARRRGRAARRSKSSLGSPTPRAPSRSSWCCNGATRRIPRPTSARARPRSCASSPTRSTSTSWSSTTSSRPRSSATWRSCSRSTSSTASR